MPPGHYGAGAGRALWTSTAAFTACFAVWTIFSILCLALKEELGLSETQFGLLVGTPILTGSLSRLGLGIWTEQYGGRRIFALVVALGALATLLLSLADSYLGFLLAGLGVGFAGGSFAVGVTYISKFFPQERQGAALAIFGAGNVGAAVTTLAAPFVMVPSTSVAPSSRSPSTRGPAACSTPSRAEPRPRLFRPTPPWKEADEPPAGPPHLLPA